MKTTHGLAAGAALAVLTALLAACGGSPKPSSTPAAQQSAAQQSTAPAAQQSPEVNPAGDIPDDQVFVAYASPSGIFSVKVPEGWARTTVGPATVFTDKLNSIRIESGPAATEPTPASAAATEVPALKAQTSGFTPGKVTIVRRKAGPAVEITYKARSAPDPVTGKIVTDATERYEFWKSGQKVVLTLSGPVGADNVDPWRIVTDSFGWRK